MVNRPTEEPPPEDSEEVRRIAAVLADPLRVRLLAALAVESPLPATVLARRTGEPLPSVRRHLRALVDRRVIAVESEGRPEAAVEHYFVLEPGPWSDVDEHTLLGEVGRQFGTIGRVRAIFEEAIQAASEARPAERTDQMAANLLGRVDEQGWRELSALHRETLDLTRKIIEESRTRLETSGEEAIDVIADQILLEAPRHAPDAGD